MVFRVHPLDLLHMEGKITPRCCYEKVNCKTLTTNLIVDKSKNYLNIDENGFTTVPTNFMLQGNSITHSVKRFKALAPERQEFVHKLHKQLRVLAVTMNLELNGNTDLSKYKNQIDDGNMMDSI